MKRKISRFLLAGIAVLSASVGAVAVTAATDAPLLDSLQRGMWQLRAVAGGSPNIPTAKICLGSPTRLIQMQHGSAVCEQYVVRSTPNSVTVSYSCKGQGQGLTTVRKESGKLLQIQTQGIRNNAPFSFAIEARYSGPC
jgi:hypothetical protein